MGMEEASGTGAPALGCEKQISYQYRELEQRHEGRYEYSRICMIKVHV